MKLLLSSLLATSIFAFAYTQTDIDNAQFFGGQGIIVTQSTTAEYRLNDRITRAEAIGTALKLKGTYLPENYQCRGYFSDITNNGWICRAIEIAADNGIISRENIKARPEDSITRAESLAIMIKASVYPLGKPRRIEQSNGNIWSLYEDLKNLGFTQWQADLLDSGIDCKIFNSSIPCEDGADFNTAVSRFRPNIPATRAEVFEFTRNIIQANKNTTVVQIPYITEDASGMSEGSICNGSFRLYIKDKRIPQVAGILRATIETLFRRENDPGSTEFGPWNLAGMYQLKADSMSVSDGTASINLAYTDNSTNWTDAERLAHVYTQSGSMQFSEAELICGIKSQITALAKQFPTVQKVRLTINDNFISEE